MLKKNIYIAIMFRKQNYNNKQTFSRIKLGKWSQRQRIP